MTAAEPARDAPEGGDGDEQLDDGLLADPGERYITGNVQARRDALIGCRIFVEKLVTGPADPADLIVHTLDITPIAENRLGSTGPRNTA